MTASYVYNESGVRTQKTVNGTTTEYFLSGSTILAEKTGSSVTWYLYDSLGSPVGYEYGGAKYWYITNLQGDVLYVVNSAGTVIGSYAYSPYGDCTSTPNSSDPDITAAFSANHLTYRGYYYDTETGLYYVSSRYYDPKVCRFISSDDVTLLGVNGDFASYNLFVYCGNNPISRADSNGHCWLITVGIGLGLQYMSDVVNNLVDGKTGIEALKPTSTIGEYIAAGVTSLIPGTGFGASLVRNVVSEGIKLTEKAIKGKYIDIAYSAREFASGVILDGMFEIASNKVTDFFQSKIPQNYSSYANSVRQKCPNATKQQISQKLQTTAKVCRIASKVTTLGFSIVRSCLPIKKGSVI